MPNNDRISEVYKGEIWSESAREEARGRVHWLVHAARGATLDLGCSQGIATILAAREGLHCVGVDIEWDALEYAGKDRSAEPADVRSRAVFVHGHGASLPFRDETFDTVLAGEVIEHLISPEFILTEVARVLRPGGTVALTTPFGYSPHHDHRQSFYVADLVALLARHLTIMSADIRGGYFRVLLTTPDVAGPTLGELLTPLQSAADATSLDREQELHASRRRARDLDRSLHDERDVVRDLDRRVRAATAEGASTQSALDKARSEIEQLRRAVETQQSRLTASDKELAAVKLQLDRERTSHLSAEHKLRYAQWELRKLKARRGWQLLETLRRDLAAPQHWVKLPFHVTRVAMRERFSEPAPLRPGSEPGTVMPSTTRVLPAAAPISMAPPHRPTIREMRVGAVVDVMTRASLAPDCDLITFRTDNWRDTLEEREPHLVFVESAWEGNGGSWQYQVGSYAHPNTIGLPHLTALTRWCRDRGIPTVFWNKEDPVHFDKFSEAARLFDVVFTSDAGCVARYLSLPERRFRSASALSFAAQPALHNPVSLSTPRVASACFAGTYYRTRHVDRQGQLGMLLDGAAEHGLVIYDRKFGSGSDAFGFPERFQASVRGGLSYDEVLRTYKEHRVFLNTNSVTDSPTMFSRRVFELLACGTPVVSTPALGMEQHFGDVVVTVADEDQAKEAIGRLLDDFDHWLDVSQRGIRAVLGRHTYAHRLAQVAAAVDLPARVPSAEFTLAVESDDDESIATTVAWLAGQTVQPSEILIAGDGSPTDRLADIGAPVRFVDGGVADSAERACRVGRAASHDWVAYVATAPDGPATLLEDLQLATTYSRADVIGPASSIETRHTYNTPDHRSVFVRTDLLRRRGHLPQPDDAEAGRAEGIVYYSAEPCRSR